MVLRLPSQFKFKSCGEIMMPIMAAEYNPLLAQLKLDVERFTTVNPG
jgi:hypothetical protein